MLGGITLTLQIQIKKVFQVYFVYLKFFSDKTDNEKAKFFRYLYKKSSLNYGLALIEPEIYKLSKVIKFFLNRNYPLIVKKLVYTLFFFFFRK